MWTTASIQHEDASLRELQRQVSAEYHPRPCFRPLLPPRRQACARDGRRARHRAGRRWRACRCRRACDARRAHGKARSRRPRRRSARAVRRPSRSSSTSPIFAAMQAAIARAAPFNILVNNAGTNRPKLLIDVTIDDFDAIMGLNVRAAYFVAQAVARRLIEAKQPGSIVNVSSQMGHVGAARRTVYCASKHAMEGFTKAMAIELAPAQHPRQLAGPHLPGDAADAAVLRERGVQGRGAVQDQARPPRPARRHHRRHRLPRLGRLVADDRQRAGRRRRLDGGVGPEAWLRRRPLLASMCSITKADRAQHDTNCAGRGRTLGFPAAGQCLARRRRRCGLSTAMQPQAVRSGSRTSPSRSEVRDGMRIDWNVPIAMDDGVVLSCDVFRPIKDGRYPVILTYGPYAKGLAFQDGYPSAWQRMAEKHPDVTAGSSNKYQNWEVVDPEKWVPHDYACVRVDSRGCGCSPGFVDHFSPRETRISTTASNGRPGSPGRAAGSASTASPTTASTSGTWRPCSRRTSPPCASGRAPPTGIAT